MTAPIQTVDADFARAVSERGDRLDMGLIERAFQISYAAHRGQKRMSGEAFISHSI